MRITSVETFRCTSYRVMIWLRIHTDVGLIGCADTCYHEDAVAAFVHEVAAPYLIGKDPRQVERHHRTLRAHVQFGLHNGTSSALAAIDVALWDILGQALDLPIYELLGGPVRDSIRLYNTCHGSTHPFYWQPLLDPPDPNDPSARWVKRTGFDEDELMWTKQNRTGELAKSLLDMGITSMKIWPFDPHRLGTEGQHISQAQLDTALRPFRDVRDAVGMAMDLPVELHGGWYLQAAVRIAEALEEFRPMWIEDPLRDRLNIAAHAELVRSTPIPVAISEVYAGRTVFREVLERGAAGLLIVDLGWIGGLTEAHFVAQLAHGYSRPLATHDATGPLTWVASSHLCLAEPNAMIYEGIRNSFLPNGWFNDVVTALPRVTEGYASPPSGAGLGASLRDEFLVRPDVVRRSSPS
jgi:L-alanine-DL-glutamate epimerase-like enolase superfamily enzyme